MKISCKKRATLNQHEYHMYCTEEILILYKSLFAEDTVASKKNTAAEA